MTRPNRRNVRVKDVVRIQYEVVPEDQLENAKHVIDFMRSKENERYPFRPRPLEHVVEENMDPGYRSLADFLRKIDQKLDFVIHSLDLLAETSSTKFHGDVVRADLSGTGMQFACNDPFAEGTYLRMSIFLGSYTTRPVHLLSKVMRVEPSDAEWGPQPHRLAVQFVDIPEEDSEVIISHVFEVQRAQLRAARWDKQESE